MMFELLMHMFALTSFIGFAKLFNGDESCQESVLSKIKQCTLPVEEYVDIISTTLPILVHNFLKCVKIPIRRRCGKRAWNLIFRLFMATSRILSLQCKMDVQENYFIEKLFLTNEFNLENRQTSLSRISIVSEHIFKIQISELQF
ncbi:hypothetical protein D917_00520 [Trichinella nativa]|uniref:Uncharacterized protein n=1 Tax=Trichinella nativa TaxID=6335 RepID=A0A1Y3ED32_9BILA|nr:hypothetical protein D917_00520 [Trichinella nativa]